MHKITVEGLDLFYFCTSDPIEKELNIGAFMRQYLSLIGNIRLVIYKTENLYLYWSRNENLLELDKKIAIGNYSDKDFEFSLLTFYQAHWCVYCKSIWDALVVCGPEFYREHPKLYETKMTKWYHKINLCPKCKSLVRQDIVDIYGVHDP